MGLTVLGLALAGCGGGASSGGGGESAGGGSASSGGESAYAGPIRSSDVALGQQRYDSRCGNACHNSGGANPLNGIGWSAERVRRQVREGGNGMSAVPVARLSDDDLEAVLAYLVTVGAVAEEATPAAQ